MIYKIPCIKPHVFLIPESSVQSIHDVCVLLLGCAVLCDQRETYIEQIKTMDLHVQTAIVDYIKQVCIRTYVMPSCASELLIEKCVVRYITTGNSILFHYR